MLTRTATIGLAVLKSAIGLRSNYSEVIEKVDFTKTGCRNCMHFLEQDAPCSQEYFPFCEKCRSCAKALLYTTEQKIYVNEKNKYGIRHELKKNALLLFIYLHYLNPDKAGLVFVDIEHAAELLQCTERTVKNNLRLLDRHGYIVLDKTPVFPGYYKLFISEYSTYFLPANKGGRGYCTMPAEHLTLLRDLININSIRLAIRNLIPETTVCHTPLGEQPFVAIQRELPSYCSRRKILELTASEPFQKIFAVSSRKYFLHIKVRESYSLSNVVKDFKADCRNKVLNLVDKLQKEAKAQKSRYAILLLEEELNDICNIALKVPVKFILDAIRQVNEQYILQGLKIESMGALVRTVAMTAFQS